jgi:hypothetical protein
MDTTSNVKKVNPLLAHMRQPKVYIKLPSGGKYWPEGSLTPSVNGEYPVYSMTAKDELTLKTPDALVNGQAVVDVIQSCMPNVINGWDCPNIDIDVILIALRIATYGHMMPLQVTHEDIEGGSGEYEIDLRTILDQLQNDITWDERIEIKSNLILYVRPLDYATVNKNGLADFESQRIMSIVQDEKITDEQRLEFFKESFKKLAEITVNMIGHCVYRIDSDTGSTEDAEFIAEFMENSDREIFDAVKRRLDDMKKANSVKPMNINLSTDPENPKFVELPIVFDYASFFA